MTVYDALNRIAGGGDLTASEAEQVMGTLMIGEVHHGVIGGLLVGMQVKGVTGAELAGFATAMRKRAVRYEFDTPDLVDTCGTGGGRASFNLSTGAAILAAACGAKVAKHGNRAVTSFCGSADVLEALGIPIEGTLEEQWRRLDETGLVFLYAPNHHPAMRHVAPVRKALQMRTFFNLLGPLSNPAGANRQLIGIYDPRDLDRVAEALTKLDIEHAFVVHGRDGMDEVSPCTETEFREVKSGRVTAGVWSPNDFAMLPLDGPALAHGADIGENAAILREALTEKDSPRSAALIPNTAVTLVLAGIAVDVADGAMRARAAVASGDAARLLGKLAG
ncbi:MAG: anthranilate phosphoribosyltransferase [Armatimonadetes bacterium]|nr:anthranilate phosphoribosyltransferase [Armatimonadota bacterium]MBX3109143.1 anthranilate phosphoribosyltransferase [Fimbriimonadaceae bacterium]